MRWTEDEINKLDELMGSGTTRTEIPKHFPNRSIDSIEKACRRYGFNIPLVENRNYSSASKEINIEVGDNLELRDSIIKSILSKSKPVSFHDFCDLLQVPPAKARQILNEEIESGKNLRISDDGFVMRDFKETSVHGELALKIKPVKNRYKIGVISDTHSGSAHQHKAELKHCVDTMVNEYEINTIFHSGDFLEGNGVYKGQEAEVLVWGMDAQVEMAAEDLPAHNGLKYYMIGGNHDYSFVQRAGGDPLVSLCSMRPDIINCGWFNKVINLNGIKIEMHHPDGGGSYAISYLLQKQIDATPGGLKPHIYLCGHYHQQAWIFYRNVQAFLCLSFQGQSLFLKRKKLYSVIGGMILDIGVDEDGSICDFSPRILPYYEGKLRRGVYNIE
jgi:predicted phosphodiesterase